MYGLRLRHEKMEPILSSRSGQVRCVKVGGFPRKGIMAEATTPSSAKLQPLCYEHHVLMRPVRILAKGEMYPAPTLAYTCPDPDCLIHYSSPTPYFLTPMPHAPSPHPSFLFSL